MLKSDAVWRVISIGESAELLTASICRVRRGMLIMAALLISLTAFAQSSDIPPEMGLSSTDSRPDTRSSLGWLPGENIDPHYASLILHSTDLVLPGNGGLDIRVERVYNAGDKDSAASFSMLGSGWSMHYGVLSRSINGIDPPQFCARQPSQLGPTSPPVFQAADGRTETFYIADDNTWRSPGNWRMVCATDGSSATVTSPDGVSYRAGFSPLLYPISTVRRRVLFVNRITDSRGNYLNIEFNPMSLPGNNCQTGDLDCFSVVAQAYQVRMSKVSSSDGRSVLFNYKRSPRAPWLQYWVLDNITDGTRTITYDVTIGNADVDNRHTLVATLNRISIGPTMLDSYTYIFGAAAKTIIRSWRTENGGEVVYDFADETTFDWGCNYNDHRIGVQRRTFNGKVWQISFVAGDPDITTFILPTIPTTTYIYKHIGYQSVMPSTTTCVFGVGNAIWRYGLINSLTITGGSTSLTTSINYSYSTTKYSSELPCGPYSPTLKGVIGSIPTSNIGLACQSDNTRQTDFSILTSKVFNQGGLAYQTIYENPTTFRTPRKITEAGPFGNRVRTLRYFSDISSWVIDQPKDEMVSTDGHVLPDDHVPPPTNPCATNPAVCQ